MFGLKHVKFDSMTYVMHYKNGSVQREGRGLSFFHFTPKCCIYLSDGGGHPTERVSFFATHIWGRGEITKSAAKPISPNG